MSEAAAEWVDPKTLKELDGKPNPRKNDHAVAPVASSIVRFGFLAPIVARRSDGAIAAGHTRWRAALEQGVDRVRVVFADFESDEDLRAYRLADNGLGEIATWDDDSLRLEIRELAAAELDIAGLGWDQDQIAALLAPARRSRPRDEPPELQKAVVSKVGDVYQLGPHRVMCGDSTVAADVAVLLGDELAHVLHADPPYGMGKEADGVANDNLYRAKLDAFLTSTWSTWRPHLADNASVYVWGNAPDLWRWWYTSLMPFEDAHPDGLALRNEIVWDKGSGFGMGAEATRCYSPSTERCLFAMRGAQEFGNVNKEDYWEGWEPIRSYLAEQCPNIPTPVIRFTSAELHPMSSTWFTKSQWVMIPEHHYEALRIAAEGRAFLRPYADRRAEYDAAMLGDEHLALRREWAAGRAFFDNQHDVMRDVWEFPRVAGEERHGHATPKPVAAMERVARTSAPEGGLVVEPFGGSGSTLMGCAVAGRRCFTMELLPQWVDVIRRRYTRWARENGIEPGPGALDG